MGFQYAFDNFKSIYGRHVYVYQHDIRQQCAGMEDGVSAIIAFFDDGETMIVAQQEAKGFTDQFVVVNKDDAD
jgi:hypothetical protein